jgi:hypothetical protein
MAGSGYSSCPKKADRCLFTEKNARRRAQNTIRKPPGFKLKPFYVSSDIPARAKGSDVRIEKSLNP